MCRKRDSGEGVFDKIPKADTPIQARDHVDAKFFLKVQNTLIERIRNKEIFKKVYFYTALVLMIFVVVGAGVMIWRLAQSPTSNATSIIASIVGLLSTLFGLPMLMAKYLFSQDEDETITQQLEHIRDNDALLRMKEKEKEIENAKAIISEIDLNKA